MAQINKPDEYFNTKLYTGNGSTQSFTGVGFQPDLIWVKSRSNTEPHIWTDVVRGANKNIRSNATSSEFTDANNITSFDSDGFSVGTGGAVNENTYTFASWNWLAGGTASSNTDGSITSNVSANTTSGFSIVSYTGNLTANATVGHSLGVAPAMIIIKNRTDAVDWFVYHKNLTSTYNVKLNTTDAEFGGAYIFDSTSSTFKLRDHNVVNGSGDSMIAYVFAEKQGFSKFGSYIGNGSTDGTFVYTGFKPAMVIYKKSSGTENWFIHDNKRQGFNPENELLFPDLSNAEGTVNRIDLLSNGFKATTSDGGINGSGATYIYMAFAENPFVTSTGVPATAR